MSDQTVRPGHDPLCFLAVDPVRVRACICERLGQVRADERDHAAALREALVLNAVVTERERIAQALEASQMRFGYAEDAARIARGGGSDG